MIALNFLETAGLKFFSAILKNLFSPITPATLINKSTEVFLILGFFEFNAFKIGLQKDFKEHC